MPNIIEQQDLLKGLPDTRLAMLLQNPTGDIPPFLVAAEAQRRQAIRQQFAGSENKESVVDSLTKQLSKVPQNIRAPAQTPPMVPPTPEMQGVAALQAQQAVQQMAQPQEMRRGGVVQRYQAAGLVQQSANPAIENMAKTYMMLNPGMTYEEAVQRASIGGALPTVEGLSSSVSDTATVGNFDAFPPSVINPDMYDSGQGPDFGLPDIAVGPTSPSAVRNREEQSRLKKQYQEYAASQPQPEPDETPDEFRARYEELLAAQEPSDWEKAQRYFAMAEQFLDPSKTTMQSVAGAGEAFAQSAAEQARAQREAELGLKKGMLEYDVGKAEEERKKASDLQAAQVESMKYQGEQALREAELYRKAADDAKSELADYESNMPLTLQMSPESAAADPRLQELRERVRTSNEAMKIAMARANYYQRAYGQTFGTYGKPGYWTGEEVIR